MGRVAGVSRFEDLIVWQKAMVLADKIYVVTSSGPFSRDYPLRDQIRKATISVVSNIAEGFGRYSAKEFRNYLSIARGSAYEIQTQLYLARKVGHIKAGEADQLIGNCQEICRLNAGLRRKIKY
jgi:four helix bundle protein